MLIMKKGEVYFINKDKNYINQLRLFFSVN